MRNHSLEKDEESEADGEEAEDHVATAAGHANPDHGEAGHAAAEHGEAGQAADDNNISDQERSDPLNNITDATHTVCEVR